MASIRIANDNDDPYQNYPGGTPNFDERIREDDAPMPVKIGAPTGGGGSPDYDWQAHIDPRTRGGDERRPDNPIAPLPDPFPGGLSGGGYGAGINTTLSQPGNSDSERAIREQYQRILGRAPDANELRTDLENAAKYGLTNPNGPTGGVLGTIAARANNAPGSGQTGDPFRGWTNPNDPRTGGSGSGSGSQQRTAAPYNYNFNGPSYESQFSDPISSFLETWSNQRRQSLENPPQGSGQQLFENILKQISDQFQSGGYTTSEKEQLSNQAIEPIEQLRQARKQQVLQSLSSRGIDQRSGVAVQMLADVDRQFDSMRGEAQRGLGVNAANMNTQRMMQAVQLLQQLAGTQDQRLNQAFNYASVPYNMSQQAFQNASQLYGATGNPLSLVNPLLQLQQQQQGQTSAQQEALGYLVYLMTQGRGA